MLVLVVVWKSECDAGDGDGHCCCGFWISLGPFSSPFCTILGLEVSFLPGAVVFGLVKAVLEVK